MALFDSKLSMCPLCSQLIGAGVVDTVSTSHFIGDPDHPLWRYSDAIMHRRCFDLWDHRYAFLDKYIEEVYPKWAFRFRFLFAWAVRRSLSSGRYISQIG